jgi:hypothetical protein
LESYSRLPKSNLSAAIAADAVASNAAAAAIDAILVTFIEGSCRYRNDLLHSLSNSRGQIFHGKTGRARQQFPPGFPVQARPNSLEREKYTFAPRCQEIAER